VTRLRKMMLEELERRNYSAGTTRRYPCMVPPIRPAMFPLSVAPFSRE
jgi:hypothetical protein